MNEVDGNISPPDGSECDPAAPAACLPAGVAVALARWCWACAVFAVYGWFLHAPFIFDDIPCIVNNPSIMHLSPLWGDTPGSGPLWPPQDFTTAGRPLVNLTLAMNVGYGGLDPAGFHFFNVLLHVFTSLLVWVVVRRTLTLDYFQGRFRHVADPLALLVAILWAVHPLQTEAVEYVSQRTELLMGLFYLATLAASLRYMLATSRPAQCGMGGVGHRGMPGRHGVQRGDGFGPLWCIAIRTDLYRRQLPSRPGQVVAAVLGLALGWALFSVELNRHGPRSASAGFHLDVPAYVWWCTQAKVLLISVHEAGLWPWPLVIHYDVPYLDRLSTAWPWLLSGLLWALPRWSCCGVVCAVGFVAASELLILSPTLIVPIISEVAAERRMYLPLASIVCARCRAPAYRGSIARDAEVGPQRRSSSWRFSLARPPW